VFSDLGGGAIMMKDEVLALVLDEPITEKDTLEYRERLATGMLEQCGDFDWVCLLTGLRIDENREWFIYDLVPPRFTFEELKKADLEVPVQVN